MLTAAFRRAWRAWLWLARAAALAPVRFYRLVLSPMKRAPTCRFLPTCSEYALEAIEKRGVVVGGLKAAWRLCRCNPLFPGGFDPVESPPSPPSREGA